MPGRGTEGWLRRHGLALPHGAVADFLNGAPKVAGVSIAESKVQVASAPLVASDAAAGILSWENPESEAIIILQLLLDVITKTTDGMCTVDAGVDTDGTNSVDTLINGQDIGAATGVFASTALLKLDENGGTTPFITVSKATNNAAGLVGRAYIKYIKVPA